MPRPARYVCPGAGAAKYMSCCGRDKGVLGEHRTAAAEERRAIDKGEEAVGEDGVLVTANFPASMDTQGFVSWALLWLFFA